MFFSESLYTIRFGFYLSVHLLSLSVCRGNCPNHSCTTAVCYSNRAFRQRYNRTNTLNLQTLCLSPCGCHLRGPSFSTTSSEGCACLLLRLHLHKSLHWLFQVRAWLLREHDPSQGPAQLCGPEALTTSSSRKMYLDRQSYLEQCFRKPRHVIHIRKTPALTVKLQRNPSRSWLLSTNQIPAHSSCSFQVVTSLLVSTAAPAGPLPLGLQLLVCICRGSILCDHLVCQSGQVLACSTI